LGINRFLIVLRLVAIEGILVERIVATAVAASSLTTCPAATIRTKCFCSPEPVNHLFDLEN
jgi:hypothetical protein